MGVYLRVHVLVCLSNDLNFFKSLLFIIASKSFMHYMYFIEVLLFTERKFEDMKKSLVDVRGYRERFFLAEKRCNNARSYEICKNYSLAETVSLIF